MFTASINKQNYKTGWTVVTAKKRKKKRKILYYVYEVSQQKVPENRHGSLEHFFQIIPTVEDILGYPEGGGALVALFWSSGDVCTSFKVKNGSHNLRAMFSGHSGFLNPHLEWHLPTSWWSELQSKLFYPLTFQALVGLEPVPLICADRHNSAVGALIDFNFQKLLKWA